MGADLDARTYLAGCALKGLLAHSVHDPFAVAKEARIIADAQLAELVRTAPKDAPAIVGARPDNCLVSRRCWREKGHEPPCRDAGNVPIDAPAAASPAPVARPGRCSVCGATRLNHGDGTFDACGFLECPDPLRDWRAEHPEATDG
jgi:hypothetical protein